MADNNNIVTLTIDGRETKVPRGTTVLEAAKQLGIEIPTFCWHPKLKPVGACRICYVEIEKMPKLQVSCATEVMPGMVVHTDTEKVKQGRKAILEFILLNHPLDCPTCDKGGECDLQDNTFAYGIDDSRYDFNKYRYIRDRKSTFDDYRIGPEIIRNQNRCILCFKCVRSNKEIFGEFDIGVYQRGNISEIDAAPGQQVDSIYSGNLVEICPVGALTNTDWRYKIRTWLAQKVNSVCQYCADGCNLTLWKNQNKIFRCTSRRNDEIDEGWICDIGRYGYQVANADNRLKSPLVKKGDKQVPVSWDEALSVISGRLKDIRDKKGGVCIGGMASPMLDTASLYAFSKFIRTILRSNNIDFRLEYKMLPEKFGDLYSRMTSLKFSIADIEKSDLILVIGSNLIKEHPIVNLRVRKAVTQKGAILYTINPFATKSGDISTDEMIHTPGTLEALLNGICISLVEQHLAPSNVDTSGIKLKIDPNSIEAASKISGISRDRIDALAKAISSAKHVTIITGELLTSSPQREILSAAVSNLALLGDIFGKGQIGFLSKYSNSKGAEKVGVLPHLSQEFIDKLKNLWGFFPENEGLAVDKMIRAAKKEEIDSIFLIGSNLVMTYPDGHFVREGLAKLDFLVVADLFETETTELADVALPLSGWAEYDGEFINLEGRPQKFSKAITAVESALPARDIINKIAALIEKPIYTSLDQLNNELKTLVDNDGSSNIVPPADLYEVKFTEEKTEPNFSLPLYVTDDLHHFGHLTEKSKSLSAFCNEPYIEISPSLAEKLHLISGSMAKAESEVARVILPVRISENIDNDVVLICRNFATSPINDLQMRKRRIDRVKLSRVEKV